MELGPILALVGMVILLLAGLARQRARKQGRLGEPAFLTQQRWLHLAAFGFIIAALFLLWGKR